MSLLCFKLNPIASHCLWDATSRLLLHFRLYGIIQIEFFVRWFANASSFWIFGVCTFFCLIHKRTTFTFAICILNLLIYPSVRWNYKQSWCCFGNYDSKMEKKISFLFCMFLWWKLVLGVDWNIDPSSELCIAIFI